MEPAPQTQPLPSSKPSHSTQHSNQNPQELFCSAADIQEKVDAMTHFFSLGTTHSLHYRRCTLESLRSYLKKHETEALSALEADLGKSATEGYATELGIIYDEIRLCLSKMYT